MGITAIARVFKKELRLVLSDKRTLAMYLLGPIMIMVAVGSASMSDIRIPIALVDQDKTDLSGKLLDHLKDVDILEITECDTRDDADSLLHARSVVSVVVIPKDFQANITNGKEAKVEVTTDATKPMIPDFGELGITKGVADFQKDLAPASPGQPTMGGALVSAEFTKKYREFASLDLSAPALFTFVIIWISITMTSMSIVGERIRGTMSRLKRTPISMVDLVLGKFLASTVTANLEIVVLLLVATQFYGLLIQGSFIDAYLAVLFTAMVGLALGIVISAIAKSDKQSSELVSQVLIILVMTGGIFIPFEMMPPSMQAFSKALPIYYSQDAIRSIFMRGFPIEELTFNFIALGLYTVVPLIIAIVMLSRARL